MDELKTLIKQKIKLCLTGIDTYSNSEYDLKVAEVVEHLARAYSYLHQINED